MKSGTRRLLVGLAGFVIWLFCFIVAIGAMAQTGTTVPHSIQMYRWLHSILSLPWSWLPRICFTWGFEDMAAELPIATTLGLLWALPMGVG